MSRLALVSVGLILTLGFATRTAVSQTADPKLAVTQDPMNEGIEFKYAQHLYKEQKTDEFFGVTQWVRFKLWKRMNDTQKDRWLSLEMTGLARHCRWSDIDRLHQSEGHGLAMAEETMSIIRLKQPYRRFREDARNVALGPGDKLDAARSHWAATAAEFAKFDSPLHLKAHVESLCGR